MPVIELQYSCTKNIRINIICQENPLPIGKSNYKLEKEFADFFCQKSNE